MLDQLKQGIKNLVYRFIPAPYVPASYSQAGEDAILRFLFNDLKQTKISYLDLGTNIPDLGNNTYLFYKNGSRGVCVEADGTLINAIRDKRPEDKVIHAGVSFTSEKEADFYVFDEPSLNTFDKEEAENRNAKGTYKISKVVKVPLITINELIRDNFSNCPDLLSIDIEGLDLDVLKSLDLAAYPIPVICAETCGYSENHIRPKDTAILDFMNSKGYIVYADTYINTLFVNSHWFNNRKA